MYIPRHFLNTNDDEAIAFMQRYSFGIIVTCEGNKPVASHLPFLIAKGATGVTISSHFAKANPQAEVTRDMQVLVIFSEPHAYISPRHYAKEQSVPTWNYISVHAYGKYSIIEEDELKMRLLEQTISTYEEAYMQQWSKLPLDFKEKMLKGTVAFEVNVTKIEAKHKLSQNRSVTEQQNIINELSKSSDSNEVRVAEYMRLNSIK
jgi:transcriptional regulator